MDERPPTGEKRIKGGKRINRTFLVRTIPKVDQASGVYRQRKGGLLRSMVAMLQLLLIIGVSGIPSLVRYSIQHAGRRPIRETCLVQ